MGDPDSRVFSETHNSHEHFYHNIFCSSKEATVNHAFFVTPCACSSLLRLHENDFHRSLQSKVRYNQTNSHRCSAVPVFRSCPLHPLTHSLRLSLALPLTGHWHVLGRLAGRQMEQSDSLAPAWSTSPASSPSSAKQSQDQEV